MKSLFIAILISFTFQIVQAQNSLNYYISKATQNSPLLKVNENEKNLNQLEFERIEAIYHKPQLDITGRYAVAPILSSDNNTRRFELNPQAANNYIGYDLGLTNGGEYQALLNITQPLFVSGRYNKEFFKLRINQQIIDNNRKLTSREVERVVTEQYLLCQYRARQISQAKHMLDLVQQQLEILKLLAEKGIYKSSDIILMNVELQNTQSLYNSAKINYRNDLLDLNSLCGIDDTAWVRLEEVNLAIQRTDNKYLWLESFRLDSLNLSADYNLTRMQYLPQVSIFGNSGLWAVHYSDLSKRWGVSAGINLTWNIYDGGQKHLNRQRWEILNRNVSIQKNYFWVQNNLRIKKILNEIRNKDSRLASLQNQLRNYDHLVDIYKVEFSKGLISVIDFLTILRNKISLQDEYEYTNYEKQVLISSYNYWAW